MPGKLSDAHRCFLQTFISQHLLNEADAIRLFQDCSKQFLDANVPATQFPSFLNEINTRLRELSLEIRRGQDEEYGRVFYGLVNLHQDEASKLATDFDAKEIGYFKKVMDQIIASDEGVCSSVELVNSGAGLQPAVGVSEATGLLEKFSRDKWLAFNRDEGHYFLGARTLIELLPHLRGVYGDAVVDCPLCTNVVVKGQHCSQCDVKVHTHCASRVMGRRDEPQCPGCQAPWPHHIPEMPVSVPAPAATAAAAATPRAAASSSTRGTGLFGSAAASTPASSSSRRRAAASNGTSSQPSSATSTRSSRRAR